MKGISKEWLLLTFIMVCKYIPSSSIPAQRSTLNARSLNVRAYWRVYISREGKSKTVVQQ